MSATVTSDDAREELAAVERALPAASATYDRALETGGDADAAELRLAQLQRKHARLARQIELLRQAEAVAQKMDDRRATAEADAALIECQQRAVQAFETFVPQLRERLSAVVAFAREHIGPTLEALFCAQSMADSLHDREPAQAAPGVVLVHAISPDMLSVRAAMLIPENERAPHLSEIDVLIGVESYLRANASSHGR